MQGLQVSRIFEEGERFFNIGDGRSVLVLVLGIITLIFRSNVIVLSECHFYPLFLLNIISIGLLTMNGYEISIKKIFFNIIVNGVNVINGRLNNKIYILSQPISIMCTSNKYLRIDDVSDIYL